MNWGWKITVVYLLFVAGILTLVFKSTREKVELVTGDYYAQELVYQQRINAQKNAEDTAKRVHFDLQESLLIIQFPEVVQRQGNVRLYRPSDSSLDRQWDLTNSGKEQTIPLEGIKSGQYVIQFNWSSENTPYYFEEVVYIP